MSEAIVDVTGELAGGDAPFRIHVDGPLQPVGATSLEIKGIALAERHHFVEARDGTVRRMLVVQLEGFLPSNDEVYRYRLPDPVDLGGVTWGSWVFAYAVSRDDAAPETGDTVRHLAAQGLSLEDEQVMARYARILGEGRREILVFYHEPLRRLGHSLASAATDEGELRPELASIGAELRARARRAFRIGPA